MQSGAAGGTGDLISSLHDGMGKENKAAMASPRRIVVRKIGPDGREAARYHGVVVQEDAEAITLMAKWESPQVDLCYVVLEPGDVFVEHFFRARWHNVFEMLTN